MWRPNYCHRLQTPSRAPPTALLPNPQSTTRPCHFWATTTRKHVEKVNFNGQNQIGRPETLHSHSKDGRSDRIVTRAVRYDDIYRMDEIKSLSFHFMFYRLFRGVAKYIVYGNTLSSFEWLRSLYAAHHGAWTGDTERPARKKTRSSFLNEGLHLSHGHVFLSTAVLKQPILSRWNSNNSYMRAPSLSVWEERAFSFLPTLNNYINTLICIRIPVFTSILINTAI